MSHLIEDLMRVAPAPTLRRETVSLVANLLIAGGLIAALSAGGRDLQARGVAFLAVLVLGVILRWVWVLVRTRREQPRS